jgi:apolipoprotein N-acyltransferase
VFLTCTSTHAVWTGCLAPVWLAVDVIRGFPTLGFPYWEFDTQLFSCAKTYEEVFTVSIIVIIGST